VIKKGVAVVPNTVIRVENVSKKYVLNHEEKKSGSKNLRDVISNGIQNFTEKLVKSREKEQLSRSVEEFWALKDVSFEINEGDRVGIVGRNGAGKSTLLKILSRITEPTKGTIRLNGRVASLLEVGTGFHPELTGRENIFLNGAVLGMSKDEIKRKFDEIVAFAEVEKFLDTPVKRYSSGMYVRLAFAVAAHLEPEILIVDEVLAVGDAQFQEKCLGKMTEVGKQGRTILFVSHNMVSVQHLCTKAILLKSGQIAATGLPSEILGAYFSDALEKSSTDLRDWKHRTANGEAYLTQLDISDGDGKPTTNLRVGETICFTLHAEFSEPIFDPSFGVVITNSLGEPIIDVRSVHDGLQLGRVKDKVTVQVEVKNLGLYPGRYFLSPWISDSAGTREIDYVQRCSSLHIEPALGPLGDMQLHPLWGKYWIPSSWKIHELLAKG
jgi:lipopolysaccharide transport system ATP-binding protein